MPAGMWWREMLEMPLPIKVRGAPRGGLGVVAKPPSNAACPASLPWGSASLHVIVTTLRCRPAPLQPSLDKAQAARPGEDVYAAGREEMRRRLRAAGWLDEEETVHIKGNGCWFITAKKA